MCKWNRFLAAVLSASMLFTMTPVQGLAADQAVAAQEESTVNEADEENDNSADAGSEQAVDTNAAQGENEGTNSDSVTPTESDDAGQQNVEPSTENGEYNGDNESQSGSDSDAVSSSTEGVSEGTTDTEISDEEEAEESETSEDTSVTTEAAGEGASEDAESAEDETIQYVQSSVEGVSFDFGDSDALLEEYANRMFYGGTKPKLKSGANVGNRLTGLNKLAYTKSKSMVAQVADGLADTASFDISEDELNAVVENNRFCTASDLGLTTLFGDDGRLTSEAFNAIADQVLQFSLSKLNSAMMLDFAYELYWGTGKVNISFSYYINDDADPSVKIAYLKVGYTVDSEYRLNSSDPYSVDMEKTGAIRTAVENARQIVSEAAGMSDYYKLNYYKEQICDRVEYDHEAARNGDNHSTHNPWNLVYVFDNDPTTNVVCEGYSEAFQYLAEQTSFKSNAIKVYSVTGTMGGGTGAGGHKWNIVHMDDDKNYLADITNSDSGSIGSDGSLFLKKMDGSVDTNYYKDYASGDRIVFSYDSDTIDLYTVEELTLSDTDYGVQAPVMADDKAVLKGLSLFLTDKIGMRVYVKTFATLADNDYLEFSYAGQTKQIPVANAGHAVIKDSDGSDISVLTFEAELWTKQMTDVVTFHMVIDGNKGASKSYSVRTYADQILAGDYTDKEKKMVRTMLNYGGYAQNYFSYNTDVLANIDIYTEQSDPVQTEDPDLTNYDYSLEEASDTKGFNIQQAALQLATDVHLVYYYKLTDNKTNDNFTFELVGSDKELEFGYDNDKGMNTVKIKNILPYELNQMFKLQVTPKNESDPVMTINYGPFSYCKAKIEHGSTAIKNLCKALYHYWDAANNLVGSNIVVNLKISLEDNNEAREFAKLLPMTLTMSFDELAGGTTFGSSITNSAEQVEEFETSLGDLILFNNRQVYLSINNCVFSNGVFQKIGHVTNMENFSDLVNVSDVKINLSED